MIDLFRKYLDNRVSLAELQELMDYYSKPEHRAKLTELINVEFTEVESPEQAELARRLLAGLDNRVLQRVKALAEAEEDRRVRQRSMTGYLRVAAATAMALTIGAALYFYGSQDNKEVMSDQQVVDIRPGGNRAILTVAGGEQIKLDSTEAGIAIRDGEVRYEEGRLVTKVNSKEVVQYITLSTPRGGQYRVELPDGSMVWLNAASSLRYPSRFMEANREVVLLGEAYFEVVPNQSKPFIVTSAGQSVQVLGTKFNINAYLDEGSVATTLVEGSVRVLGTDGTATATLTPGQQASLADGVINVRPVDIDYYTGWMTGRFIVNRERLSVVLRQIERWYDVEFVNDTIKEDVQLWGALSRNVMLSELLKALETNTGVKFKQEGRRVIMSQ